MGPVAIRILSLLLLIRRNFLIFKTAEEKVRIIRKYLRGKIGIMGGAGAAGAEHESSEAGAAYLKRKV